MKRTKQINHASFRKYWRVYRMSPIALAVGAVFVLAGCEKSDENISLYMNSDDDTRTNSSLSEQYITAYNSAQQETVKTTSKYSSRADRVTEFGEDQCIQVPAKAAGMAAEFQNSGGMWIPLMAGYMMGHMMGSDYTQQPLFNSHAPNNLPARDQFVDASGRAVAAAAGGRSMTIPKTILSPKPVTTQTITRGGFGETVAKQSDMRTSNGITHSTIGS